MAVPVRVLSGLAPWAGWPPPGPGKGAPGLGLHGSQAPTRRGAARHRAPRCCRRPSAQGAARPAAPAKAPSPPWPPWMPRAGVPGGGCATPDIPGRALSLTQLVEAMRAVHAENEAAQVRERAVRACLCMCVGGCVRACVKMCECVCVCARLCACIVLYFVDYCALLLAFSLAMCKSCYVQGFTCWFRMLCVGLSVPLLTQTLVVGPPINRPRPSPCCRVHRPGLCAAIPRTPPPRPHQRACSAPLGRRQRATGALRLVAYGCTGAACGGGVKGQGEGGKGGTPTHESMGCCAMPRERRGAAVWGPCTRSNHHSEPGCGSMEAKSSPPCISRHAIPCSRLPLPLPLHPLDSAAKTQAPSPMRMPLPGRSAATQAVVWAAGGEAGLARSLQMRENEQPLGHAQVFAPMLLRAREVLEERGLVMRCLSSPRGRFGTAAAVARACTVGALLGPEGSPAGC